MERRFVGYLLVGGAIALALAVFFINSRRSEVPLIFSPSQILGSTWDQYKKVYLEAGTLRTLDKQRNNVTTSEGQGYTLLRAVWMDDHATFDAAWQWTKNNLQHKNDHLFAWLFGRRPDGTFGILIDQGGNTTASDADQDIALALVFAYARWQDTQYLNASRAIISDIWNKEVMSVGGTPYLVADDIEKTSSDPTAALNPSYFSPASYRIFAQVDQTHPWGQLVDSAYALLGRSITAPLDTKIGVLPPDWLRLNKHSGVLSAPSTAQGSSTPNTNYSYDALRISWRLALDYVWFGEPRATDTLARMKILSDLWRKQGALPRVINHDGTVLDVQETPAMYGGSIGFFMLVDPSQGSAVYDKKLQSLFDPDLNTWKQPLTYYDDNWAWFGVGLYNQLLPNLAASLPARALTP